MSATASSAGDTSPHSGTGAPERIVITALRLLACPCGRDLQQGLRQDSPAAHLVDVMQVIDRAARRPLRLNPPETATPSADETAFVNLVAAVQAARNEEAVLRARSLVKVDAVAALISAVSNLAKGLERDGIMLLPAACMPPCGCPVLHPVSMDSGPDGTRDRSRRLSAGQPAG